MTDRTISARVLIVVENMSVPTDRRVWKEARTLTRLGIPSRSSAPWGRRETVRHTSEWTASTSTAIRRERPAAAPGDI